MSRRLVHTHLQALTFPPGLPTATLPRHPAASPTPHRAPVCPVDPAMPSRASPHRGTSAASLPPHAPTPRPGGSHAHLTVAPRALGHVTVQRTQGLVPFTLLPHRPPAFHGAPRATTGHSPLTAPGPCPALLSCLLCLHCTVTSTATSTAPPAPPPSPPQLLRHFHLHLHHHLHQAANFRVLGPLPGYLLAQSPKEPSLLCCPCSTEP